MSMDLYCIPKMAAKYVQLGKDKNATMDSRASHEKKEDSQLQNLIFKNQFDFFCNGSQKLPSEI